MKCECGGKTKCLDSRVQSGVERSTRRRYQCKVCGKRFSTLEFVAADGESIKNRKIVLLKQFVEELKPVRTYKRSGETK